MSDITGPVHPNLSDYNEAAHARALARVEEARAKVLSRLCDCETTAQFGHSSSECMNHGVAMVDALIAAVAADARRRQQDEMNDKGHGAGLIHPTIPDVAETEPRPEWADISSAPKDGTEVLLMGGSGTGTWKRTGYWARRIERWSMDAVVQLSPPTHWTPLPSSTGNTRS